MELPLIDVLVEMEFNGVAIDTSVLDRLSEELSARLSELEGEIYEEAGEEFKIGSPKQLSTILFEKLGLPTLKKTKTGYSTDAEVLEQLSLEHRLPSLLLEYRQLSKLKSTYVDALPTMIDPSTGRIHASFNQAATTTGRLSSSDPNLQNIPIRTELGSRIRAAFIPSSDDRLIMSADYSQIELRVLAHLSGDKALIKAFEEDKDIHAFVASEIFGVPQDEVDAGMRRTAKAVDFGIVYGLTPYGLSRNVGISVEEADGFIQEYFERYPGVRKFIDDVVEGARRDGYVSTMFGRRRPLHDINSTNAARKNFEERAAVNMTVQGTAADMIKIAMVRIHRRLKQESFGAKMILQIHDELLFDCPSDELDRTKEMVLHEMQTAVELNVPVRVNIAAGRNWLEAK